MTSAPNPSIMGEIVRRAFNDSAVRAARRREVDADRAALDEAELHDLEQAEYYGRSQAATPSKTRSLLDRILGR